MKQKLSMTIDENLVNQIDKERGIGISRSLFVESVIRVYFRGKNRKRINII
ncbi:MAG: hypothetical protein ACE5ES_05995 [Candidatus Nanoarchaeia archaeon]